MYLPYKAYWFREAPAGLTFNNCTLCPHCIYVFCIYLRTNSDLCHLQHKLIGFYNRDEKCLLRGTDWVLWLKQSALRLWRVKLKSSAYFAHLISFKWLQVFEFWFSPYRFSTILFLSVSEARTDTLTSSYATTAICIVPLQFLRPYTYNNEALRYKPEGRGFDSRWCHWNFSLT